MYESESESLSMSPDFESESEFELAILRGLGLWASWCSARQGSPGGDATALEPSHASSSKPLPSLQKVGGADWITRVTNPAGVWSEFVSLNK